MTPRGTSNPRFLVVAVLATVLDGCGSSPAKSPGDAGSSSEVSSANDAGDTLPSPDAGACGFHDGFGAKVYSYTPGPQGGRYEGPALVERSTATELVLSFQPAGTTTGTSLPMHTKISNLGATPLFPIGAKVWLSKAPGGEPVSSGNFPFPPPQPWSIAVRDRQGGRLLFGAAYNPSNDVPSPIALGAVTPSCTTVSPDPCLKGANVTYSTVDVLGDKTVTVRDSETSIVPIGGFDYDVRVTAQKLAIPPGGVSCLDYSPSSGVTVEVRARDLAALVGTLEVGAAPACIKGNVDFEGASFAIGGLSFNAEYAGPAFYSRRVGDTFQFTVSGLTTSTGDPALLLIEAPRIFKEPRVGEEFWASVAVVQQLGQVATLRGPKRGPLLLGTLAFALAPFDATTASKVEQALGVAANAQERCAYASSDSPYAVNGVLSLWDVVFGSTPAVRLPTLSTGIVPIAGRDYNTWVSTEGNLISFTLQAR